MNKTLTSIAAAAVALTLVACGSDDDSGETPAGDAQTPSTATAEAAPPTTTTAPPAEGESPNGDTPITITAGDTEITATLNDSEVAQDFAEMLPVDLTWFRNAGIEYITELDEPLTETGPFYTDVQAGDIVYYNPLDSITIIYAPTSSVPTLTKMGEVTSDLSVFEGLPDNTEMRIERG